MPPSSRPSKPPNEAGASRLIERGPPGPSGDDGQCRTRFRRPAPSGRSAFSDGEHRSLQERLAALRGSGSCAPKERPRDSQGQRRGRGNEGGASGTSQNGAKRREKTQRRQENGKLSVFKYAKGFDGECGGEGGASGRSRKRVEKTEKARRGYGDGGETGDQGGLCGGERSVAGLCKVTAVGGAVIGDRRTGWASRGREEGEELEKRRLSGGSNDGGGGGAAGRVPRESAVLRRRREDDWRQGAHNEERGVRNCVAGGRGAVGLGLFSQRRPGYELSEMADGWIDARLEKAGSSAQGAGPKALEDHNSSKGADEGTSSLGNVREGAPPADSTRESRPGQRPRSRTSGGGALTRQQLGLIGVGASRDPGRHMVLTTLEVQDIALFAPAKPGKFGRFAGAFRRATGGSKVEESEGSGGEEEGGEEGSLSRETVLVPAADATVRTTLKPWLRDNWQIEGEISTITEEMDEDTMAEVLKDVFSNSVSARAVAEHWNAHMSVQRESWLSNLYDPEERQKAMTFALSLEVKLKPFACNVESAEDISFPKHGHGWESAVITLCIAKDVLLGVVELTGCLGLAKVGVAGLEEVQLDQQQEHSGRTATMFAILGSRVFGRQGDMSLKRLVRNAAGGISEWPAEARKLNRLVRLISFAYKGIDELRYYGDIMWCNVGDVAHVRYNHVKVASMSRVKKASNQAAHIVSFRDLVFKMREAAVFEQESSSTPKVYRVHPALHSVTLYPGCALKPFCEGWSDDGHCDRIRWAAARAKHNMVFIVADNLVIILNFKTSNACIFAPRGKVLEGAITVSASVKPVDELFANQQVEGEMEIDRIQGIPQVKIAKDDSDAQGIDPTEKNEWEGTAMEAAATWLQSTYLLWVENCWYIRQNPRWRRVWKSVVKLVRQHRLTGISVLSAGFTWNTVIVKDNKIITFLCEKMRAVQNGWHEVTGSKDVEEIVRATSGNILHLNDNVFRLCRSTIEESIACAKKIRLNVLGRFSGWRHLYSTGKQAGEQEGQNQIPFAFDYLASDPHQVGGRWLWLVELADGYYVKLRNGPAVLEQRWYKLQNAPDSPVLGLDGQFRDDDSLREVERAAIRMFNSANTTVSIGTCLQPGY